MANLRQIWKNILNIGRHDGLHYLEIQKNAILNAISFTTIILSLVITVIYTYLKFKHNLIALVVLPVCFTTLWFNHKRNYDIAKAVSFFGFLIVISYWSLVLRRTNAELLFISVACGSASIIKQRKNIFFAVFICVILYFTYIMYDYRTVFEPDVTINYFVIKAILAYTTAGTVFFITMVFVDITSNISKRLDKNFTALNIAFEHQKDIEKKLVESNNELSKFNKNLDSLVKKTNEDLYSYQTAIDDNLQSIVTDANGIILKINDLYLKKTDYFREELIGQSINILKSSFHDDSFYENINKIISSGSVWRGESKIKTKYNMVFWINSSILPILDPNGKIVKYLTISTDITDKKLAEEKEKSALKKLIKSEKRLSLFLENQTDLVVITDKIGTRKYVNKAFCTFFGRDKDNYIGTNYRTYEPDKVDESYLEIFDSISYENPKISIILVRENALGEKRWIKWDEIAFFDANKKVVEILSIGHDVTEIKEREFQSANYISQFEELAFKNSHRFRRPLSNIIGVIDLVDDDSTVTEIKELITIIKNEINDLDLASHELSDFINANSNTTSSIADNNATFKIDFTEDKLRHLKWKYKVRNYLDGIGTLTKSQVTSHLNCETGNWLYGEGKEKYAHIVPLRKFEKHHENLHHLVKDIIEIKTVGESKLAEQKYLELVATLDKVILLLDEAEYAINNESIVTNNQTL